MWQKLEGMGVSEFHIFKNHEEKKSLEPFGICLQNSTANLAHFHSNWAWLAVLFSRKIQDGSHSLKFLSHIILGSAGVEYVSRKNTAVLNSKVEKILKGSLDSIHHLHL